MFSKENNQSSAQEKVGISCDEMEHYLKLGYNFGGGEDPPASDPPASDPPASDGGVFSLPEQYKDKAYLTDVKSYEDVFKKLDGAESMLGRKRTLMPDETFTPEMTAAYHKERGVPDDHSTYVSGNTADGADLTFFNDMKPAFKKANMTAKQVASLEADLGPVLEKISGGKLEADKLQGEAFDALTDKIFAGTKTNDLAQAKILMDAHVPAGLKDHVSKMSNEDLVVIACVMKGVRAKHINEDNVDINGGDGNTGGAEAIREEGKKQIAIANDPTKGMAERTAAKKLATELYTKYDKMTGK